MSVVSVGEILKHVQFARRYPSDYIRFEQSLLGLLRSNGVSKHSRNPTTKRYDDKKKVNITYRPSTVAALRGFKTRARCTGIFVTAWLFQ